MNARIRVGVVGLGQWGQHHVRIYKHMPGVDLVGVVDGDEPGRRVDPVLGEELAAELFRRLNTRSGLGGADDRHVRGPEGVPKPRAERSFRADDGVVDPLGLRERDDGGRDGRVGAECRQGDGVDADVRSGAGGDDRRAGPEERRRDGVLSGPGSDDENPHRRPLGTPRDIAVMEPGIPTVGDAPMPGPASRPRRDWESFG